LAAGLSSSASYNSALHSPACTRRLGRARNGQAADAVLSLLRLPHLWPRPLMRRSRRRANLQSLRLLPHLHQRRLRLHRQCAEPDRKDLYRRPRPGARRMQPTGKCGTSFRGLQLQEGGSSRPHLVPSSKIRSRTEYGGTTARMRQTARPPSRPAWATAQCPTNQHDPSHRPTADDLAAGQQLGTLLRVVARCVLTAELVICS
jgi:hypothetical protein